MNRAISLRIRSINQLITKLDQRIQQQQQQQVTRKGPTPNISTSTYSTIDKKKFIKTDNGLVYTPVNNAQAFGSLENENGGEVESCFMNEVNDNGQSYEYDNFEAVASRRPVALVKKPTQFQAELSQKLKSINNGNTSNNGATTAVHRHMGATQAVPEHMSNSTATTSISSASSCASNSDLIVNNRKMVDNYHHFNGKSSASTHNRASELNVNGNKNYSLLKTTINGAANNTTAPYGNGNGGTLNRNKPPILKPKPRSNGLVEFFLNVFV